MQKWLHSSSPFPGICFVNPVRSHFTIQMRNSNEKILHWCVIMLVMHTVVLVLIPVILKLCNNFIHAKKKKKKDTVSQLYHSHVFWADNFSPVLSQFLSWFTLKKLFRLWKWNWVAMLTPCYNIFIIWNASLKFYERTHSELPHTLEKKKKCTVTFPFAYIPRWGNKLLCLLHYIHEKLRDT